MKIVKVNMFSNKVIYCTEHDKKDNPPPQKTKSSTANTTCEWTERYGTLATAHQRSYLLLVADSVNKWGPARSEGAVPHTLRCNSTNNVTVTTIFPNFCFKIQIPAFCDLSNY